MGYGKIRFQILTIAAIVASFAQTSFADAPGTAAPALAVVPQIGVVSSVKNSGLEVTAVSADVEIGEKTATTTLKVTIRNASTLEAKPELLVPLPAGAGLPRSNGRNAEATIVVRVQSQKLMRRWIETTNAPALLEFAGFNWLRKTGVTIPAKSSKTFNIKYWQPLTTANGRADFVLPRSQLLSYNVPWKIAARIRPGRAISTVYSPSHDLNVERTSPSELTAHTTVSAAREPGPFRLTWLFDTGKIAATLFTRGDLSGGNGYFLLLVGPPADTPTASAIKREITFVIDRSASMKGPRLDQVRAAVASLVKGLSAGEAFNIIQYNDKVSAFAKAPVGNTATTVADSVNFLKNISPRGGTNTYDALRMSLSQKSSPGKLPIVLFLTDGLPTFGNTSEAAIRKLVVTDNRHKRRIYTIGVGVDVKTPLLEGIAAATRGRATFILPNENVGRKIAEVVNRLKRPVLADVELDVLNSNGTPAKGRVHHLQPAMYPDLFHGDQLVVLGRYAGAEPLVMRLRGNYLGKPTTFQFRFEMKSDSHKNDFVPRLWASRRIAGLVDEIRQAGANALPSYAKPTISPNRDVTSRIGEILRLTARHGVLTEYTAFAGRAPMNWNQRKQLTSQAVGNLNRRAVQTRAGVGSVNQEINGIMQRGQSQLNYRNGYYNAQMKRVAVNNVQQIGPDSFFLQNGIWIDGRLLNLKAVPPANRTLRFGSAEFFSLSKSLAKSGRQGAMSLPGSVLLLHRDKTVLVSGPAKPK